jgi:hypothetical protein
VDCGIIELITTLLLSQNPFVGPSIWIPIILSLYCNASLISTAIRNATNSLPKVLVSMVLCLLECHHIGAPLTKKVMPVLERHVT